MYRGRKREINEKMIQCDFNEFYIYIIIEGSVLCVCVVRISSVCRKVQV